jgi:hypothetical protein
MGFTPLSGQRPELRLAHQGSLLVAAFTAWPSSATLASYARAQLDLARVHGKLCVLTIIPAVDEHHAKLRPQAYEPAKAVREQTAKTAAEVGDQVATVNLGSAMLVLLPGLTGSFISSLLAATTLLSRNRTPLRVFRELTPAVEWLAAVPGASIAASSDVVRDVELWLSGG